MGDQELALELLRGADQENGDRIVDHATASGSYEQVRLRIEDGKVRQ
jgi:hypothetical protein